MNLLLKLADEDFKISFFIWNWFYRIFLL